MTACAGISRCASTCANNLAAFTSCWSRLYPLVSRKKNTGCDYRLWISLRKRNNCGANKLEPCIFCKLYMPTAKFVGTGLSIRAEFGLSLGLNVIPRSLSSCAQISEILLSRSFCRGHLLQKNCSL